MSNENDTPDKALPIEDWQWLADQLRAWPEKRVHPERTMCDGALRPMAADVIEAALAALSQPQHGGLVEALEPFARWARWALETHRAVGSDRKLHDVKGMLRDAGDEWSFGQQLSPDEPRLRLKHFRAVLSALSNSPVVGEDAIEHLRHVIDRDRYVVALGLGNIRSALDAHRWLLEGRGPYEWDDDRYRDEFTDWVEQIERSTGILAKLAWDKSDCTTDTDKVIAAKEAANAYVKDSPTGKRNMLPSDIGLPCPSCAAAKPTPTDTADHPIARANLGIGETTTDTAHRREAVSKISQTLAFLRSVIISGERWSATCEMDYSAARDALAALSQPQHGGLVLVNGTCRHVWAYAPTVGYYECMHCHERHNHGSPEYDRIAAALSNSPVVVEDAPAIPAGMKPWHGGDRAPDDWDGNDVQLRDGAIGAASCNFTGADWQHTNGRNDIIAYTSKPAPTDTADRREAVAQQVLDKIFAAFCKAEKAVALDPAPWVRELAADIASLIAVPDGMCIVPRDWLQRIADRDDDTADEARAMIAASTGDA